MDELTPTECSALQPLPAVDDPSVSGLCTLHRQDLTFPAWSLGPHLARLAESSMNGGRQEGEDRQSPVAAHMPRRLQHRLSPDQLFLDVHLAGWASPPCAHAGNKCTLPFQSPPFSSGMLLTFRDSHSRSQPGCPRTFLLSHPKKACLVLSNPHPDSCLLYPRCLSRKGNLRPARLCLPGLGTMSALIMKGLCIVII